MISTPVKAARARDGQKVRRLLSGAGYSAAVFGYAQMLIAAGYSDTNTAPENEIVIRLTAGLAIFLLGGLLARLCRRAGK